MISDDELVPMAVRSQDGDPANDGVAATVTGDAAEASLNVSLCFF